MFSKLKSFAVAGVVPVLALAAAAQAHQDQPSQMDPQKSMTCRFDSGPRAGQTVDLTGSKHAKAVRLGESCSDGKSKGVAVSPEEATTRYGGPSAHYMAGPLPEGYSRTCAFNKGPKAGSTVDLTGSKHGNAVAIGKECTDGQSKGVAVSPGGETNPQP